DALGVPGRGGLVGNRFDLLGDILDRVEPCAPADAVDRLEAPGRNEPRPRILRHALAWPLLERGAKRVVQRFLREVEIAEKTDQRREDAARLGAIERLGALAYACCRPLAVARIGGLAIRLRLHGRERSDYRAGASTWRVVAFALSPSKPVMNGASGEVLPPFDRRPTGNREFV